MKLFTRNILILIIYATAFIGMTSFMLFNISENSNSGKIQISECIESSSQPLTSTGDFLGFYTTIALSPNPFPIEVMSFSAFSSGTTTLQGPWSSTINFTQTNILLPTNTSAYNPVLKELVCIVSGEQQLLEYEDMNMSAPNPINLFPNTATAPVYFTNQFYAIWVENDGYADLPLLEANIVYFDYQTATFSSVLHVQNTPTSYTTFNHESMSSATNITDEMYFLSGSSLVVVTDLSFSNPAYCWIDLDPNRTFTNYFYFYGVEYKSPGVLMAIRETFANGNRTATDLVQINFNSTNCTVGNITVIYDLMNNFQPSPAGWVVNSEFYSTTYDTCRKMYYLSTLFTHLSNSRLVEIDVQNATHVEQILPEYLFGIEWKQEPCPCEASFVVEQLDNCGKFLFTNTSTGPSPMTCFWDFDDPGSGVNNTSVQCQEMHQFSTCGTYNVCLTINAVGCMKTICQPVTVADITPPVALCKNNVVLLLNANCIANVSPTDIDAGSFDDCSLSLYDVTPHSFSQCGTFPVTLTVTDWCGNTDDCVVNVQVIDPIPPVITCPTDVYLTTTATNCTMVVNGLQWLSLSDNCGTPTVAYQVTGATTLSGNGDVSGQIFNQGVSIVTYTATDNCGNKSQCSFKVVMTCVCTCSNNIVQNPGFTNGGASNWISPGVVSQWEGSTSPLPLAYYQTNFGCCDPNFVSFSYYSPNYFSYIYQQGLSFLAGHHYKVSFCAKAFITNSITPVEFIGLNSPIPAAFNPNNCSNCESVGTSPSLPYTWSTITLPIWTPSQNRDVLFLRAIGSGFGLIQADIDNICVEEVFYFCCSDDQAFIENTDNAINTYVDQENWEGVVEIGNLMECNSIDYINWGDGTILDGPIFGNTTRRHKYIDVGNYEVQYQVREFDPQDTSQTACLDHIFIDDIIILPDTCYCGEFGSMAIRWDPDFTQEVSCGNDTVFLGCPSVGKGYDFTGTFYCNGTLCPTQSAVNWVISGPSGNFSGTSIANPFFGISILPSYVSQPGVYSLSLSGTCGSQSCICTVNFVVDCPDLCPCGLIDIHALATAVNMGFSQATQSNSCKACFSPGAISNCETVEWHIGTITPTPLAITNGNQTFCHTFPNSGSYTLIMVVNRKKQNGDDCETFTFSKQVNISCQSGPECNDPHFVNPNFNEGSVAGGLNSGGSTRGWIGIAGNPIVEEGVEESPDGWAIYLSGNADYQDILQTKETLCLDSDMGTLTLRARACPCSGDDERERPRQCDIMAADVTNGLEMKRVASFPLTDLDPSVWWEFSFPFDLSEWTGIDSCSENPGSNSVFLRISVSNPFGDNQGGPLNFTDIQVDNACLDNLVFISDPTPILPVKISPNPNDGGFIIDLPQPARKKTTMQIMSMTGQVILEKLALEGNKVQSMEARHLLPGMYFLQIVSDGRVTSVDKFVKM